MCASAIFFAGDRVAVFAEMARILRPGGRFVFTCDEDNNPDHKLAVPDWTPLAEAGGLIVDSKESFDFAKPLQRMYDLWMENIDILRVEVGEAAADALVWEATNVGPTLATRTALVITTRRP